MAWSRINIWIFSMIRPAFFLILVPVAWALFAGLQQSSPFPPPCQTNCTMANKTLADCGSDPTCFCSAETENLIVTCYNCIVANSTVADYTQPATNSLNEYYADCANAGNAVTSALWINVSASLVSSTIPTLMPGTQSPSPSSSKSPGRSKFTVSTVSLGWTCGVVLMVLSAVVV